MSESTFASNSQTAKQLIDLSHVVRDGLITYRGLPAPIVCDYLSRIESRQHYADGTEFHIGKIEMVANTGTYVDSPFHRYPDGKDLAELPLHSLADVPCVVVRTQQSQIDASCFRDHDVQGKAVLVDTGWSRHWNTDLYFEGHPFLTADAATYLRDQGAAIVGIDSLNIDDITDARRPVHSTLLAAEIPIVEHLTNLSALPDYSSRFFAVPVKVAAMGTFPVRAFATVAHPFQLTCRLAEQADVPLLARLNQQLIQDEASRNQSSLDELQTRMANWLNGPWRAVLFENDGRAQGYVLFRESTDEYEPDKAVTYIRQFLVLREHRQQGFGRAAFEHARAQYFGSSELVLDVLESNIVGKRFWESLGFQPYCTTMKRAKHG